MPKVSMPATVLSMKLVITNIISQTTSMFLTRVGACRPSAQKLYLIPSHALVRIEQALRKLKPVEMNSADRSPCLPGTRLDIIEFIINWATNPSTDHSMLWIHGLAGSGKSTLSTTVANYFLERGCLGAFLFFNRDFGER